LGYTIHPLHDKAAVLEEESGFCCIALYNLEHMQYSKGSDCCEAARDGNTHFSWRSQRKRGKKPKVVMCVQYAA
jgi:hypothetical protein